MNNVNNNTGVKPKRPRTADTANSAAVRRTNPNAAEAEAGRNAETARRSDAAKSSGAKNINKNSKRTGRFKSGLILVVFCYLVILGATVLTVYVMLPKNKTPETQNYVYQVGENGSVVSRNVFKWDVVRTGDTYYLDMTGIADYCDFITTGSTEKIRYIERSSRETIEFYPGTSLVSVNGYTDHMDDNSYCAGGKVYVPLEFVNRTFIGVSAELDTENNKITVKRDKDERGNFTDVSFTYRPVTSNDSILFSNIDPDIQNEILARERAIREQREQEMRDQEMQQQQQQQQEQQAGQ